MPTDTRPNSPAPVIRNHHVYYLPDGNLFIKVDSTLFRVHQHFFTRESDLWRNLLGSTPNGRTANNPLDLDQQIPCDPKPTAEDFACLLWVFYNPRYSIYETSEENWLIIYEQAYCWHFIEVQNLCLREMEKLYNRRAEDLIEWYSQPRDFNPDEGTVWTLLGNGH
jgi:hypothetical protein